MDVTLMELLWTFKNNQEIMIFKRGVNISGLITVESLLEEQYKDMSECVVDFIKPEVYGGVLGYKEQKYIEIYLK